MSPDLLYPLIEPLCALVAEANRVIMAVYATSFTITNKADNSPVTQADLAADALILGRLTALTPDIAIVTEEQVAAGLVPDISDGRFWLVDPLDGTREFCHRVPEFTVNIALVEQGVPVLGVVGVPATGSLYWGGPRLGAFRRLADGRETAIATRPKPDHWVAIASRSHRDGPAGEAFLAALAVSGTKRVGSALKLVRIAEGEADVQPRLSEVSEWDLAAGCALVIGAGGHVLGLDGQPLRFGAAPRFLCPHHVICSDAMKAPVLAVLAKGGW